MTKISPLLFWALILLIVIGITVAWFSTSQKAGTDTVAAATGEEELALYVSSIGGDAFVEGNEADIVVLSNGDLQNLMPVSTADLKTFLTSTVTESGIASSFAEDSNGENYYHGQVFIKAVKTNPQQGETMGLYLDTTYGEPVVANDGDEGILTATRLGLTFDGGNPVIMSLSNDHLSGNETTGTMVNNALIPEGQVITMSGGSLTATEDPASHYSQYSLSTSNDEAAPTLPGKTLINLEFGKIYTVDLYFYLEGCDPDCVSSVGMDQIVMQVNFYGVLQ